MFWPASPIAQHIGQLGHRAIGEAGHDIDQLHELTIPTHLDGGVDRVVGHAIAPDDSYDQQRVDF